jgi:hypothetical protein
LSLVTDTGPPMGSTASNIAKKTVVFSSVKIHPGSSTVDPWKLGPSQNKCDNVEIDECSSNGHKQNLFDSSLVLLLGFVGVLRHKVTW